MRYTSKVRPIILGIFAVSFSVLIIFGNATAAHADITSNLVGYWTFDDGSGTTATDSSGNNQTGTLNGTNLPAWTTGVFNGALNFDGVNDYVDVPFSSNLEFGTGNFSISAWVYPTRITSTYRIVGTRDASPNPGYIVYLSGSTFQFLTDNGPGAAIAVNNGIPRSPNIWYNVVAVRNGSTMRLYVNGVESTTTATQAGNLNGSSPFQIGSVQLISPFGGMIDDVRVYNRALSQSDVTQLFQQVPLATVSVQDASSITGSSVTLNGNITNDGGVASSSVRGFNYGQTLSYGSSISTSGTYGIGAYTENVTGLQCNTLYHVQAYATNPEGTATSSDKTFMTSSSCPPVDTVSNLSGWWKLDDGSGTTVADSSGNGNSGILTSGTGALPLWTPGAVGGALNFDGTGNYVNSDNPSSLQITGAMTVSAWVNFANLNHQQELISKYLTTGNERSWQLGTALGSPFNTFQVDVSSDGTTNISSYVSTIGNSVLTPNKWYNIAFTYTPSSIVNVYVNGVLDASNGANIPASLFNSTAQVFITNRGDLPNLQVNGSVDDVRVYSRALSPNDITALYNAGFTPTVADNFASLVTMSSATLNATTSIVSGLASSTVRGFAYGTSIAYGATTTENGNFGIGPFSASISSLSSGTTYHFRAYASNATDTGYSGDQTFTTYALLPPAIPIVVTSGVSSVATSSFTLSGSITDTGGADANQSGFAYGTTPDLSNAIATTALGGQSGTASFNQNVSGLSPNTTYYFRAYASNQSGTSTGSTQSVATLVVSAPTAPINFSGTATNTEAFLTWSAPSSDGSSAVTDYVIEYKPVTSSSWSVFNDGISAATSTTVTGLINGTGYDFRVSASNSLYAGPESDTITLYPFASVFFTSNPFVSGQGGYNTYRIPAIAVAPNGDILAFAEGRVNSGSDFGNIDIVMKRSTDGGHTWSTLSVLADNGTLQAGNPGMVVDSLDPQYPAGRIFLFYNTGNQSEASVEAGTGVREVWYKTSIDNGVTWSNATNITTSVARPYQPSYNPNYVFAEDWRWNAVLPGSGIQLQDSPYRGRIVIGDNYSTSDGHYHSYDFYSDDHGLTWNIGGSPGPNTNENQIVELSDGRLLMNSRNYDGQKTRAVAESSDGGQTWTSPVDDHNLIDPIVEASIERYTLAATQDQDRLLFMNPASTTARANLTVKVSSDEGSTWGTSRVIDSGAAAYSDMTILQNGYVGALYEYSTSPVINYAGIRFVNFDLSWISQGGQMIQPHPQPAPLPIVKFYGQSQNTSAIQNLAVGNTSTAVNTPSANSFVRDLTVNSIGTDVKSLQVFLNTHGFPVASASYGSTGNETNYFGALTRAALAKFQETYDITPTVGYFGPKTRYMVAFILKLDALSKK